MELDQEEKTLWDSVRKQAMTFQGFSATERGVFYTLKPSIFNHEIIVFEPERDREYDFLTQQKSRVLDYLKSIFGQSPEILIQKKTNVTSTELPVISPQLKSSKNKFEPVVTNKVLSIRARFTFDTFVVGPSNNLAFSACKDVAKNPGEHNPLFLYSKTGLGKTHLLFSIYNELLINHPDQSVLYVDAESFFSEYASFAGKNNLIEFHEKYRDLDVLLVDDLQFFLGKGDGVILEDFFNTYKYLYEKGSQIVLAADSKPDELKGLGDRIASRMTQGVFLDMVSPVIETRYQIIKQKAQEENIELTEDVIQYLSTAPVDNIRDLEGALNTLVFSSNFNGVEITKDLAAASLSVFFDKKKTKIDFDSIVSFICSKYNIKKDVIFGSTRVPEIVKARDIAMFFTRDLTGLSLSQIAKKFGGRDHSSIHYAVNKVSKKLEQDSEYNQYLHDLEKELLSF